MSIKVNRALALANIGRNPGSAQAMLDAIPADVVAALTARRLAQMLDAMWRLAGASKALAAHDAIAEGAIWDARTGRLRSIAA